MYTVKVRTHDRTTWITNVTEVVHISSYPVKNYDDPLDGAGDAWQGIPSGCSIRLMDFQRPVPEEKVHGDTMACVYSIRCGGPAPDFVLVAPDRSCYLLGPTGATVDRL